MVFFGHLVRGSIAPSCMAIWIFQKKTLPKTTLPIIMVQWKMGSSKISCLYKHKKKVVFHLHDCGRKMEEG